jgi:ABC-2 type transport system ATP-binding protein
LYEGDPSIFEGLEDEFIIEQATLEDIMYYTTRRERAK